MQTCRQGVVLSAPQARLRTLGAAKYADDIGATEGSRRRAAWSHGGRDRSTSPDRPLVATGLVWHERMMWHDTGHGASVLGSGGWLEPHTHAENPDTKRRLKNLLDATGMTEQLVVLTPSPASVDELCRVHDLAYVERIRDLSADRRWRGRRGDAVHRRLLRDRPARRRRRDRRGGRGGRWAASTTPTRSSARLATTPTRHRHGLLHLRQRRGRRPSRAGRARGSSASPSSTGTSTTATAPRPRSGRTRRCSRCRCTRTAATRRSPEASASEGRAPAKARR